MKRNEMKLLFAVMFSVALIFGMSACAKRAVPDDTIATATATATTAVGGTTVDNFEGYADTTALLNTGNPTFWALDLATFTGAITLNTTAPHNGTKDILMTVDLPTSTGWLPAATMDMMPNAAAGSEFNATSGSTGLRFWVKSSPGTTAAANLNFMVAVRTTNITDYSYWRKKAIPFSTTWTQISIPWTAFARPDWGKSPAAQGDDAGVTTFANTMSVIQGYRFIIAVNIATSMSTTGAYLEIDNLETY